MKSRKNILLLLLLVLFLSCSKLQIPLIEKEKEIRRESVSEDAIINEDIVNFEIEKDSEEVLEPLPQEEIIDHTEVPEKTIEKKDFAKEFANIDMLKNSLVGIYVIDLKTGEEIAKYNENRIITPASVMKVITSATAIEVLGADTRLKTKLLYDGKINGNGKLLGDLYIKGEGDPTLGSDGIKNRDPEAFLYDWINKMKQLGIKEIEGDLIVLDDLFGYIGVEEKWLWEDFGTNYAPGTYGISIFDNLYTLYLASNSKKVKILGTKPEIKEIEFENRLKISANGRRDFSVRGIPLDNKRVLTGEVPANLNKIIVKSDIPDPGMFLGMYFKSKLSNAGIKIKGKVKTARITTKKPKNPKVIAVTDSPTIAEMVEVLLTRSDNHYTEHLFQLIKLKGISIKKFWKEKGIDTDALVMQDGSGLSRSDYLSAEILTKVLVYMYKNYPQFTELMPRGGYDGTVSDFLTPKVFSGEARIKSGSMSWIQSYAGYLKKDDKEIAFSILVNYWQGKRNDLKKEMEKFVNQIYFEELK